MQLSYEQLMKKLLHKIWLSYLSTVLRTLNLLHVIIIHGPKSEQNDFYIFRRCLMWIVSKTKFCELVFHCLCIAALHIKVLFGWMNKSLTLLLKWLNGAILNAKIYWCCITNNWRVGIHLKVGCISK